MSDESTMDSRAAIRTFRETGEAWATRIASAEFLGPGCEGLATSDERQKADCAEQSEPEVRRTEYE